jgi:hypothetical protein
MESRKKKKDKIRRKTLRSISGIKIYFVALVPKWNCLLILQIKIATPAGKQTLKRPKWKT